MKKVITKRTLLLFTLGLFISIGAKAQTDVPVEGISFPNRVMTVNIGETFPLVAVITPEDATNKKVVWKLESSFLGVIAIDTTGVDKTICEVTAIGKGRVTLTAKTLDGNFTATCIVMVEKPAVGMTLDGDKEIEILIGRDSLLKVKIDPFDATNPAVFWESSDSSIVNLISTEANRTDSICKIVSMKPGTVKISAKTKIFTKTGEDDSEYFYEIAEDFYEVTVKSAEIEDFTLNHSVKNKDTLKMYIGEETAIIAQIRPLEGTYKYVNWTSTNSSTENIVEIISSGRDTICKIRATGVGEAKIAAETYDGQKDSCVVKVESAPMDTMYMRVDTIYLDNKYHKDSLLTATITPDEVLDKSVIFTSNNTDVVDITSVEKDTVCRIRSGYSGEAYIYARTPDGRFKDSCYVKVIVPVDSIVLRAEIYRNKNFESEPIMNVGQKTLTMDLVTDSIARLTAIVYPDSAKKFSFDTLIWNKFDPELARIDSIPNDTTCYITALWSGYDTIHVRSVHDPVPDGKDWYFINIEPRKVDSIGLTINNVEIAVDTIELNVGDLLPLETTVYPHNATNDSLELKSTRTDVLTVDSMANGVFLRALKEGVVVVRALATDFGSRKDTCIVKVSSVPVTGIILTKDTVRIYENEIDSVLAVLSPVHATDKTVSWSSSNAGIVAIQTAGTTDTVCTFKGLLADTAVIRAEINGFKDSCVVIVAEQFAFVESDTTATNDGEIAFYLKLPDDVTLTGSFELRLPKGFGLAFNENGEYKTELEAPYSESSDLEIVELNDSTYTFTMTLKASPANGMLRAASSKKKVMDIAYTIYDDGLENSADVYDVRFVDVDFTLSDETEIKEDHTAAIKVFKDETGNELIGERNLIYMADHRLYVHSAKAETVYVYALNGSLLFARDKSEGRAVFTVDTPEKILIVRGGSGWAQKVASGK